MLYTMNNFALILGRHMSLLILWNLSLSDGKTQNVLIDLNKENVTSFEHFWKNSGFSPPSHEPRVVQDYLLSQDIKTNLAYIAGLPNESIKYERVHWLFSLIKYEYAIMFKMYKTQEIDFSFQRKTSGFNFSLLDDFMDVMKKQKLLPIFELMGTPVNIDDLLLLPRPWYYLCFTTFDHYRSRYGIEYIKQWKIETWNEIDSKQYNVLDFTLKEYLNYVEECFAGVGEVSSSLIKMGPGGVTKYETVYSNSFLKFCNENMSRCNLTYITYHQKDYPKTLVKGADMLKLKFQKYPNLNRLKLANDEADSMSGWWIPSSWRADVRYPAKMCQTVILFSKVTEKSIIKFLSFDNSFLNELPFTFEQRTLLTRLKINSSNPHSQFFEKPSYSVLGMMSLLGSHLFKVEEHPVYKDITYMFTTDDRNSPKRISGLVTRSNDFDMDETNSTVDFFFEINLPKDWRVAKFNIYSISNVLPHPEKIYKELNEPVSPNEVERLMIRNAQGPHLIGTGITMETAHFHLILNNPSVTLINICSSSSQYPSRVTELHAVNITFNEVLLIWKDQKNRCISTYIVEFKKYGAGSFKKLSRKDSFFCRHHFAVSTDWLEVSLDNGESNRGSYRIAAVDYWGRQGKFSDELKY